MKLRTRIESLDRICSWIATKKSLHKLHKVRNALVDLHNLLLGVRLGSRNLLLGLLKLLFLLLGELCKLLFLLLCELCNVGVIQLNVLNKCIRGLIFPCGAFVLRLLA